jgi:hypothetical protein
MGTLFRAAIGFAVALTLLHGQAQWSGVKTPAVRKIETDIAATQPAVRMLASFARLPVPQNGTTPQK